MLFFEYPFPVWRVKAFRKKNRDYYLKRATPSIVVVTYVSYLGLTKIGIRAFYCVDIYDSGNPLTNSKLSFGAGETSIRCYGNDHGRIIATGVVVHLLDTRLYRFLKLSTQPFENSNDPSNCKH